MVRLTCAASDWLPAVRLIGSSVMCIHRYLTSSCSTTHRQRLEDFVVLLLSPKKGRLYIASPRKPTELACIMAFTLVTTAAG
jgi:hypothetical protein